jgi:Xaa-Pro aminopeptidase
MHGVNHKAIARLRQKLSRHKLDSILISKGANVSYLSGFPGEAALLITLTKKIILVDFRYKEQAARELKSFFLSERLSFQSLEKSISGLARRFKFRRLGFEARSVTYQCYLSLKKNLSGLKPIPTYDIVEGLRAIKTKEEIRHIKKAAALAGKSFTFAKRIIRPGRSEAEIARRVQYYMCKLGSQDCAFDVIVASGKRSSLPHATASAKTIKNNEPVLVDLGCRYLDYTSDLTRMVFLGKIERKIRLIYDVVKQAQALAIKAIKVGRKISEIDRIARRYIAREGLGRFFGHALGHGIGREIHEYPCICPENQDTLQEGMVLTIEPGIYLPGAGGVRVEDMVLVTKDDCEILTKK